MGVYEAADQWKEFLFKEEGKGTIENYYCPLNIDVFSRVCA